MQVKLVRLLCVNHADRLVSRVLESPGKCHDEERQKQQKHRKCKSLLMVSLWLYLQPELESAM